MIKYAALDSENQTTGIFSCLYGNNLLLKIDENERRYLGARRLTVEVLITSFSFSAFVMVNIEDNFTFQI